MSKYQTLLNYKGAEYGSFPESLSENGDMQIEACTDFLREYRKKSREVLDILSDIRKNYNHSSYYMSNLHSKES
ncbi:hypothetical protein LCGC14_2718710, partial [marine sediment metagenome]